MLVMRCVGGCVYVWVCVCVEARASEESPFFRSLPSLQSRFPLPTTPSPQATGITSMTVHDGVVCLTALSYAALGAGGNLIPVFFVSFFLPGLRFFF